jgi:glycerol-3-phosphate dehydrogenase (NAD(P)+)
VAEGYYATKAITKIAKKHKAKLPLAENMYQILYNKKDPKKYLLRGL